MHEMYHSQAIDTNFIQQILYNSIDNLCVISFQLKPFISDIFIDLWRD